MDLGTICKFRDEASRLAKHADSQRRTEVAKRARIWAVKATKDTSKEGHAYLKGADPQPDMFALNHVTPTQALAQKEAHWESFWKRGPDDRRRLRGDCGGRRARPELLR